MQKGDILLCFKFSIFTVTFFSESSSFVAKNSSRTMNTPPTSRPIWIENPSPSGFFMQTPGSADLTWIEDPSPSGLFVEQIARGAVPYRLVQSLTPSPAPKVLPGEEEASHPLLIHTYKAGCNRKIFRDKRGTYIACRENPADEEQWLRSRSSLLSSLPQGAVSTQIINVKLSTTYAELISKIDTDVPDQRSRIQMIVPNGRPSVEKVRLEGVAVVWELPGHRTGYGFIDESNCKNVLGLISARGWQDVLVALYERI